MVESLMRPQLHLPLVVLLLCGCGSDGSSPSPPSPQPSPITPAGCMAAAQEEMLRLVNDARSAARACGNTQHAVAPALGWNCQLQEAALVHSRDMASNNFLDHMGSDGLQAQDRIEAAGYTWQTFGENISGGQDSAAEVVDSWLTSPGHCRNTMNPAFTELGMGSAFNASARFRIYWTQVLAAPR
ncbi:MAG: CAP domain-containing protein [Gammaproteobacteria bacterium]